MIYRARARIVGQNRYRGMVKYEPREVQEIQFFYAHRQIKDVDGGEPLYYVMHWDAQQVMWDRIHSQVRRRNRYA